MNTMLGPVLAAAALAVLAAGCQTAPGESAGAKKRGAGGGSVAARMLHKNDADGDGRISRAEWRREPARFQAMDSDQDGFVTAAELAATFGGGKPAAAMAPPKAKSAPPSAGESAGAADGRTTMNALDHGTLCGIGRGRGCDPKLAIQRGLFETGLRPRFPEGAKCRGIDEGWAISYTYKRNREAYHGGIDMPVPWGTSIIAAAAGTVVGKFRGDGNARGKELIIRHSPEDTGIPLWIYTQYGHFDQMPAQRIGQRVALGEVLGPTGNSGIDPRTKQQSTRRRPAVHFAVFFSENGKYAALDDTIIPVEGYWMDPNALYRKKGPFDSAAMKALPAAEKQVPISIMFDDGTLDPAATKMVWPYACERR